MTLAYVFRHTPRREVDAATYEELVAAFHRALASEPPRGFLGSTLLSTTAPWAVAGGELYEDWYAVEDSAALDALNDAAVTGPRAEPHRHAARAAGWGTGALYALRAGEPWFPPTGHGAWFAKPDGVSYPAFFDELRAWTGRPGVALWQRRMTLGPPPEFGLVGPEPLDVPTAWGAFRTSSTRVHTTRFGQGTGRMNVASRVRLL